MHQFTEALNQGGSSFPLRFRYGNFVAGAWVEPSEGLFIDNISPYTARKTCEIARSGAADLERAVKAAEGARRSWRELAPAWRAQALDNIAARLEANLELLSIAESRDHGGDLHDDWGIRLAIDHFRYFATRLREKAGHRPRTLDSGGHEAEIDENGAPLEPGRHPILAAAWNLSPTLASGNCVVMRPAYPLPSSVLVFVDLIRDLLPPGVLGLVVGFGVEPPPAKVIH